MRPYAQTALVYPRSQEQMDIPQEKSIRSLFCLLARKCLGALSAMHGTVSRIDLTADAVGGGVVANFLKGFKIKFA